MSWTPPSWFSTRSRIAWLNDLVSRQKRGLRSVRSPAVRLSLDTKVYDWREARQAERRAALRAQEKSGNAGAFFEAGQD